MSLFDCFFETEHFPAGLCTIPNEREPEVMDSRAKFLCVLVDARFPSECRLRVLTPYTCPSIEDPGKLLYGWTDSQNVYDHRERSIHDDSETVRAWRILRDDAHVDFLEPKRVRL